MRSEISSSTATSAAVTCPLVCSINRMATSRSARTSRSSHVNRTQGGRFESAYCSPCPQKHSLPKPHPTSPITTDPRPLFAAAVDIAEPVIAGVRRDQLEQSSPCVDFDVKELLDHLVFVLHRVAAIGRGDEAFAPALAGRRRRRALRLGCRLARPGGRRRRRVVRRRDAPAHRRAALGHDDGRGDPGHVRLRGHDAHMGPGNSHRPACCMGRHRLPDGARHDAPRPADGRPRAAVGGLPRQCSGQPPVRPAVRQRRGCVQATLR